MDFNLSPADVEWRDRVKSFMESEVRPRAADYVAQQAAGDRWKVLPVIEDLKVNARAKPGCGTCSCRRATAPPTSTTASRSTGPA